MNFSLVLAAQKPEESEGLLFVFVFLLLGLGMLDEL